MNKKVLFLTLLIGLSVLNMATVRRAEDPIRDTQTDPISYKQKMEEEKDGKKGPLAYSVKNNPSDTFLTKTPVSPKGQAAEEKGLKGIRPGGTDWWEEPVAVDQDSAVQDSALLPGSPAEAILGEKVSEQVLGPEKTAPDEPSPDNSANSGDFWW